MQLKKIGDTTLWIGPLVDVSTGQATPVAVGKAEVFIDGIVLGSSGTACTTNAQGLGQITVPPLSAGNFRIDVQVNGCLPWFDSAILVGGVPASDPDGRPAGSQAIDNAGLPPPMKGGVHSVETPSHLTTDIDYGTAYKELLRGQILTFSTGVLKGTSYIVNDYSENGSKLALSLASVFAQNPATGDAFVLSNVATAHVLYNYLVGYPASTPLIWSDPGYLPPRGP